MWGWYGLTELQTLCNPRARSVISHHCVTWIWLRKCLWGWYVEQVTCWIGLTAVSYWKEEILPYSKVYIYIPTWITWPNVWEPLSMHSCLVFQFSSVQLLSRVRLFVTHELQHATPPCPSPSPGVHSNSRPSSQWCHLAISSSVVPFPTHPQSLPASESFPMSQLFAWGGQSTGVTHSP